MDGLYPRNIRTSCPHPSGQLKLFKFVPDKFVQEHDAEGMSMDVRYVAGAGMRRSDDGQGCNVSSGYSDFLPHPSGQLKLFKFVPDKFVQERRFTA